jgi:CheY-like chemotaxis protein
MSVILLADDSPHAQRMGQRILSEEGHQVVCVSDGQAAASRLLEVDPDVVIADAHLRGFSGIELCRYIKSNWRHVRVVLTAGSLEALDEAAAKRAGCDGILRKPFEASLMAEALAPLLAAAQRDRQAISMVAAVKSAAPLLAVQAPDDIRAAIERAVERELPRLLDELTQRVLLALGH